MVSLDRKYGDQKGCEVLDWTVNCVPLTSDRINVVEWPLDPAVCCYPIASFAHAFV